MIDLTKNTLLELYRMDNIVRYNTLTKHKQETVAAHSFYVALFTMILCSKLDVSDDVEKVAIKLALIHDTPEIITNDLTHDAKQLMPEVEMILRLHEVNLLKTNFKEVIDDEERMSVVDQKRAELIVKLADILSVYQFTIHEISMGNSQLIEWEDKTKKRIDEILEKLERTGLKCQRTITLSL